jgi:alkylhydroperoxidase family enzyme
VTRAALDDCRTAPVSEPLRATLGFLERLTLEPDAVTAADARAALDAGVSAQGLADAVVIASLFAMITRLADTLGFAVPPYESFQRRGAQMLADGYALV